MTEQALTELVQRTFDGVSALNGKFDTLVANHNNLEARHVAQVNKHNEDHRDTAARVGELEKAVNNQALDIATMKAKMGLIGAGSAVGGGGLGWLMNALIGGILVILVAGCSGPEGPPVQYGGLTGRCAADLTLLVGGAPMTLTIDGEGGHKAGGSPLIGHVGVDFMGWRVKCEGKEERAPACRFEPIVAGPGVPADSPFLVDPDY